MKIHKRRFQQHTLVGIRQSEKSLKLSFLSGAFEFHVLQKASVQENGIVLVPKEFCHIPLATVIARDDEDIIPPYKVDDDIFLSLIHVALKLRADILCHPRYQGFEVTKEAEIACIPENLYMFLNNSFNNPVFQ